MSVRRVKGQTVDRLGGRAARYALGVVVIITLVLIVLNRAGGWTGAGRSGVDDALAPLQRIASAPMAVVRGVSRWVDRQVDLRQENERLRRENEELREWYALALAMRDKMERYEELLALNPDNAAQVITARVVQDTQGPFSHRRLINAGAGDGVQPYQAVLGDRGLVGITVDVGRGSSRVMLVSDPNSAIPVMVDRNNARAILDGDQFRDPQLVFSRAGLGLREGDRIVTSGDAGKLPRGLPVGVAYLDGERWRVRLFSSREGADYVRVVRYERLAAPEDEPPVVAQEDDEASVADGSVGPSPSDEENAVETPSAGGEAAVSALTSSPAPTDLPAAETPPAAAPSGAGETPPSGDAGAVETPAQPQVDNQAQLPASSSVSTTAAGLAPAVVVVADADAGPTGDTDAEGAP